MLLTKMKNQTLIINIIKIKVRHIPHIIVSHHNCPKHTNESYAIQEEGEHDSILEEVDNHYTKK